MGPLIVLAFVVACCFLPTAFGYVFGTDEDRIQRQLREWADSIDCRITDCYPMDIVNYAKLIHTRDNTHIGYHAWVTDGEGFQHHAVVVLRRILHMIRIADIQWVEPTNEPVRTDVVDRVEFDEYFDRG